MAPKCAATMWHSGSTRGDFCLFPPLRNVPGAPAVWNWWLLTLFFLCGSAASLRAWARKRRGASSTGGSRAEPAAQPGALRQEQQHLLRKARQGQQLPRGDDPPADWLDRAVIAVFSTEMPVGARPPAHRGFFIYQPGLAAGMPRAIPACQLSSWYGRWLGSTLYLPEGAVPAARLFAGCKPGACAAAGQWALARRPQASAALDALTWLVLVPMENAAAGPASRAFWHAVHHSFESHNVGLHTAERPRPRGFFPLCCFWFAAAPPVQPG